MDQTPQEYQLSGKRFRANSETTAKKEICNCIFYLLIIKRYFIIFDIFHLTSTITTNCYKFIFLSIKTEIIIIKKIQSLHIKRSNFALAIINQEQLICFVKVLHDCKFQTQKRIGVYLRRKQFPNSKFINQFKVIQNYHITIYLLN